MENLSKLLERFSKLLNRDALIKETIIKIFLEKTGINLKPEQINLKNGVLEIETTPVAKNEIILKQEAIKSDLRQHSIPVSKIFYK